MDADVDVDDSAAVATATATDDDDNTFHSVYEERTRIGVSDRIGVVRTDATTGGDDEDTQHSNSRFANSINHLNIEACDYGEEDNSCRPNNDVSNLVSNCIKATLSNANNSRSNKSSRATRLQPLSQQKEIERHARPSTSSSTGLSHNPIFNPDIDSASYIIIDDSEDELPPLTDKQTSQTRREEKRREEEATDYEEDEIDVENEMEITAIGRLRPEQIEHQLDTVSMVRLHFF